MRLEPDVIEGSAAAGPLALEVSVGQCSSAGVKPLNQDFHGALLPSGRARAAKGITAAIADGISTSEVSHIAAETAVKALMSDYYCTSDAWSVQTAASRVIAATNSWLHAQTKQAYDRDRGHVCTLSAMVLKGRQAHLFHVGDSRIWRLSGGTLEQLTQDHTVVLSSVEQYLGRAMGMTPDIEIDYRQLELSPGDVFVLTTDGVHEHWQPREAAALLQGASDLDAAAEALVEQALAAGSTDNLTALVLRVEALPPRDATQFMDRADQLPLPPLPHVPSEFDGYRILRQIHGNDRSHIYLAHDPVHDLQVALKLPSDTLRQDAAYLKRFVMEEWIARRLNSPHVLKAAPARPDRKYLYVVTEYVQGQTLRQWMHDNPAPELEQVRGILEQVAAGLRAFHRREMLHQDLRPENIMIDPDGTVKIIDFGSTRVAGVMEAAPALDDAAILGTLQYSAPEYFVGYPGNAASDQFSLAVIAYEMLTGRLPYGADVSRADTPRKQARLRYRVAQNDARAVPEWIDAALQRALSVSPRLRYPALSEFLADLRRPMAGFEQPRPLLQRNPLLFWQLSTALLALACGVLLAL